MFLSSSIENCINQISGLSTSEKLETFTKQVVELIQHNIDCYFVGLFLLDTQRDSLQFCAGSGVIGDTLVQNQWALPINNAWMKDTIIAGDITVINLSIPKVSRYKIIKTTSGARKLHLQIHENTFLPGQILPNTRWQLFLPLQEHANVFGVLEVAKFGRSRFCSGRFFILSSVG